MKIRFFAGAADAAGTESVDLLEQPMTLGSLIAVLSDGNEAMKAVLDRCSVLVDGAAFADPDAVITGGQVDFLPPFAGG